MKKGMKLTRSVQTMLETLAGMYSKKCSGAASMEDYSSIEQKVLATLEHSGLLRAFVDPTVPFDFPVDYTPVRIELELVYATLCGKLPESYITDESILNLLTRELGIVSSFRDIG